MSAGPLPNPSHPPPSAPAAPSLRAPSLAPDSPLFADLSANARIPIFLDLMRALAHPDPARGLLDPFIDALRRAGRPGTYIWLSTRALPPGHFRIARWVVLPGAHASAAPPRELVKGADPWGDVSHLPVHSAGFLSRIVATPTPKLASNILLDDDPLFGSELAAMRSMIAAPHTDASGAATTWTLVFHPEPGGLTDQDLEDALLKTTLIGAMAANVAATRELRRASDWIQSEIDQIAEIQRSLLPQEEPDIPGLSIAAHYATFDRAGGDYYDLLPLRHARGQLDLPRYTEDLASPWAIILADASGHGPSAAVVTAMLHSILHTADLRGPGGDAPPSPAALLEEINRRLFARRIGGETGAFSFVTAFLAIYDPIARTLTYAAAGHHPPLFRPRPGAQTSPLPCDSGTPMGVRDRVGAADRTVTLEDGHTLVLYTDGVVEAPGGRDRTLWGADRLAHAVTSGPADPRSLIAHIIKALRAHESGQRSRDDQTLLVLQAV